MEENQTVEICETEKENKVDSAVKNHVLPYLKDIATVLCIILVVFLFCFHLRTYHQEHLD